MMKAVGVKLPCQACQSLFSINDTHECSCGELLCPECHGVTGLTGIIKKERKKPAVNKPVSDILRTDSVSSTGLVA